MSEIVVNSEKAMEIGEKAEEREEEEEGEVRNGLEVVRWEKFLPKMAIRVLLVEADYSTRQIIAALLRKCNYKVAAVADGLKAWEVLKRRHDSIDIILTELDLPSISGYALLSLIMEHEGCKNIPVVMMSSRDSVSMVFKCLLKGAADFLIKPVRRNELKNLWQHVWKRLAINGGQFAQNVSTGQCKVEDASKKDMVPNSSFCDVPSARRNTDSSDRASDAHSSCTTRYVEAESESMENMQGFSLKKRKSSSDVSHTQSGRCEKNMKYIKESLAADNEIKETSTQFGSSQVMPCNEVHASTAVGTGEDVSFTERSVKDENLGMELPNSTTSMQPLEPSSEAIDLIGRLDDHQECTMEQSISADKNFSLVFAPQLELSLRGFHGLQNQGMDERHTLNHSDVSAFSRYDNEKKFEFLFPPSSGTCAEAAGGERKCDRPPVSSKDTTVPFLLPDNPPSSEEQNKTSREDNTQISQPGLFPVKEISLGDSPVGYGSVFPPMFGSLAGSTTAHQQESSAFVATPSLLSDPGTHSSSVGCCWFDGVTNPSTAADANEHAKLESLEQNSSLNAMPATCQSATSISPNGLSGHLNSSAYGSTSETDGTNAIAAAATKTARASVDESVKDDSNNTVRHDQFAGATFQPTSQREAALMKFRLKRKERCYEKKVRYQSRKKLAEQRPRVKGQFVRQAQTSAVDADGDGGHENNI